MASNQTAAILVARYLKAHHYHETLSTFLQEANLTEESAVTSLGNWTLEKLLQEKVDFDKSLNFERHDHDTNLGWTQPAPAIPREPELPITANVLCIRGNRNGRNIAVSTANNTCKFIDTDSPYTALTGWSFDTDSPVLSIVSFLDRYTASATMSGKIIIRNHITNELVAERRDHSKWAVQIACWTHPEDKDLFLLATAGWDQKVNIYSLRVTSSSDYGGLSGLGDPHGIPLSSNPESLLFVTNPDNGNLYLVVSRRDSSFLYYYQIHDSREPGLSPLDREGPQSTITTTAAGRQNIAPHSNAWVAFTPSALALHPFDSTLIAIATSHLPHLKVIIVRLLFPDRLTNSSQPQGSTSYQTPNAQARAELALQDREDAAITLQVSTQAPQTPYSTPQIAWRPDGTGVWVNGDDGVVRGVEVKTGKVVALLRAHEAGSKVRTIWAGQIAGEDAIEREVMVSGGFDKKVFIWEIKKPVDT